MPLSHTAFFTDSPTWQALLTHVPQLLWLEDEDGMLLYSNHLPNKAHGPALLQFLELLHPDDLLLFEKTYQSAHQHRSVFEVKARVKAGNGYRWHLFRAEPAASQDIQRFWYGSATDLQDIYDNHLRETISDPSFRELANAMPQLVWVAEKSGEVIYYNDRITEFHGAKKNDLGAWTWEGMLHPDDLQRTSDVWSTCLNTHVNYEIEHRVMMSTGEYRWMLSRALPVFDKGGNLLRWYGSATDIHAIKLAEAANAAREEEIAHAKNQLELSIAAGNIGIWNWEVTSGRLIWTEEMCALYGITLDEWTGKIEQFQSFVHPDDLKRIFEIATDSTYEHPFMSYRFRIYRKDGQLRWIEARSKTFYSAPNQIDYLLGVNIDVTEQMNAAETLRESELRFRTLAESLPQLVWMTDMNGKLLYRSNSWVSFTGHANVDTLWQAVVHPDDMEPSRNAWSRARDLKKSFRYEVRIRNASGDYHWHFSVADPLLDAQGNVERWIGSLTDITEQKNLSQYLEDLVKIRTAELRKSNEELQQFAHVASHDLKEPLRKIQVLMDMLKAELKTELEEKQTEQYMQKIVKSAGRMNSMIDGILQYSSSDAHALEKTNVDFHKIIEHIKEDLELLISEKKAVIEIENLPIIAAHETLVHQLFYNLLNNSLKFARKNRPPHISIKAIKNDGFSENEIHIEVSDNGIGFEPKENESIFKTFRRLHSKDQYEGTGLGLALCHKIMERHDGRIIAEGTVNDGARFHLYFPIQEL